MYASEEHNAPGPAIRYGVVGRSLHRLLKTLGALGLGLTVSAAPVAAPLAAASAHLVPRHWIAYAQMAGTQFEAWLSDPASATALRLHAWMQARALENGQASPPPVLVQVWVAPSGKVQQVDFASLGAAQADDDLRALMLEQALSAPPRDMRQPMVLELIMQLTPSA